MERQHPDRLTNGKLDMRKGGREERQTRLTSSIESVLMCVSVSEWEKNFHSVPEVSGVTFLSRQVSSEVCCSRRKSASDCQALQGNTHFRVAEHKQRAKRSLETHAAVHSSHRFAPSNLPILRMDPLTRCMTPARPD